MTTILTLFYIPIINVFYLLYVLSSIQYTYLLFDEWSSGKTSCGVSVDNNIKFKLTINTLLSHLLIM